MQLRITINLDNAAFADDGIVEIERLFASIASRLPDPLDQTGGALNLHDANGNHCGTAEIEGHGGWEREQQDEEEEAEEAEA